MSVVQTTIVICNACPSLEESGRQRHPSKTVVYTSSEADALAEARNRGWRRGADGRDVCPRHPELHIMTRSQDEIMARAQAADDMFGWAQEVLLPYVDFEHAKPLLQDGVTAEQYAECVEDSAKVSEAAREYHLFALGKIEAERGISAERSVVKLREYAWLMGLDDVLAAMDAADYSPYGAPKVAVFGAGLGCGEVGRH